MVPLLFQGCQSALERYFSLSSHLGDFKGLPSEILVLTSMGSSDGSVTVSRSSSGEVFLETCPCEHNASMATNNEQALFTDAKDLKTQNLGIEQG